MMIGELSRLVTPDLALPRVPSGSGLSRFATSPLLSVSASQWRYPTDVIATFGIAGKIPGAPASSAPHNTGPVDRVLDRDRFPRLA